MVLVAFRGGEFELFRNVMPFDSPFGDKYNSEVKHF